MNAHIFTPHDDSLRARIEAYQRMVRDFHDFSANCAKLDNETLGEQTDLAQARLIFLNSFKQAQQAVDAKDLQQAQSQGLISGDDIRTIVQTQRSAQIEAKRDNQQSNQSQHKQRR